MEDTKPLESVDALNNALATIRRIVDEKGDDRLRDYVGSHLQSIELACKMHFMIVALEQEEAGIPTLRRKPGA